MPDQPDNCRCVRVGLGWNWGRWLLPLNALVATAMAVATVFLSAGRLVTRLLVLNASIVAGFVAIVVIAFRLGQVNESGMFFQAVFVWTALYCGVATAVFLPLYLLVQRMRSRS